MRAGGDRRIDHRGERRRLEFDLVAALALDGQRRAVAPAAGHRQRRLVLKAIGLRALRIEQQLIPVQHRQFAGGGTAAGEAARFRRRDEIEGHVQRGDARRDVQVEGVHVDAVALPGNGLAAALNLETHQVGDRAGGAVLAGNPLRDRAASWARAWPASSSARETGAAGRRWRPPSVSRVLVREATKKAQRE